MNKIIVFLRQQLLSYNGKKALMKGTIVAAVTTIIYLAIVVITTPNLPAVAAINAAFKVNSIVIFGLAIGVGINRRKFSIFYSDRCFRQTGGFFYY
ncbi:MAG TPA: hypothetical protein VE548_12980 [Nitrososphaeraceae archaeon]|jgi:hypothetical protein|nr:hypothetical protein [Nitrososphaeraceae archaeon]